MSGEAIYRGYDRAALDAQYNNRARIPEFVDYFDRWLAWSAETRAALPGRGTSPTAICRSRPSTSFRRSSPERRS